MSSSQAVEGVVEEQMPRRLYRVRTTTGVVTASLTTEAKRVMTQLLPGDSVLLELSITDPSRGFIQGRS